MNLFNLIAKIALDSDEYKKGLDEAEESTSDFSEKSGKSFDKVKKGVQATIKVIGAIVGAITAAAGAIVKLTTATTAFTNSIDDAAKQLQITTDQYQEWSWIMKQIGGEESSLDMAFRQIATTMSKAAEGSEDAMNAFKALGIEYENFQQLNPAEQLDILVAAFQRLESGTEKTALAQEIFGSRVYQQLMPILNDAEGSVESMKQEIHDLGLVMGEEVVQQGQMLDDKLTYMKGTVKQLAYNYGAELFPAVEMVVDGIMALATGSEDADSALEDLSDGITAIVDKVLSDLPVFLDIVTNFLIQLINGIISKIPEMVPALTKLVESILITVVEILPDLVGSIGDIVIALLDGLLRLDWIKLIVTIIETLTRLAAETLPNMLFNLLSTLVDLVSTGSILKLLAKLGLGLGQAMVNGALQGIEGIINTVIHFINLMTKSLSTAWTWIFGEDTAIPAIPDVTLPKVHWLAEGGMFDDILKQTGGKGTIWVGGEGGKPELAHEGKNGSGITPIEDWETAMTRALYKVFGRGVTLRVGDRDMRAYITDAQNLALKSQGRKTLSTVTRY